MTLSKGLKKDNNEQANWFNLNYQNKAETYKAISNRRSNKKT